MSKESTTTSVIREANKLPEEIKMKAHEYVEKRKPQFRTFGVVSDDVEDAWLNGFAFCMEGTVTVKVKQCATCIFTDSPCLPSDYTKATEEDCDHYKSVFEAYELFKKRAGDLIYCIEHCAKNELAVARCIDQLKELL